MGKMFADPRARRAYVLTKVGVFAVAALATVPLAHFVGRKAWVALGAFGAILAAITVVVLVAGGAGSAGGDEESSGDEADEAGESDPTLPVEIPIEDVIDLHPFPPRDIPAVVESYLEEALARGFREVRLIHGRGIGVQRERVRSLLSRHPAVASFADAPPERGGWGATIVVLDSDRE